MTLPATLININEERVASWHLSKRRRDVLEGVCRDMSNGEIARELGISLYAVNQHLDRVFRATRAATGLEIMSRTGLASLAQRP